MRARDTRAALVLGLNRTAARSSPMLYQVCSSLKPSRASEKPDVKKNSIVSVEAGVGTLLPLLVVQKYNQPSVGPTGGPPGTFIPI